MGKPPGEVASRHRIPYLPMHVLPAHTSAAAHPEWAGPRGSLLLYVARVGPGLGALSLIYQYLHSKRNYVFISILRSNSHVRVCMYV